MADVHTYWYGVVVELDHAETAKVLGAAAGGTGGITATLTGLLGAATAAMVGPVIAAYVLVEGAIVRAVDKGEGVILTMTWAAPGVVVPTTRHAPNIPGDWAKFNDGTFKSPGNDQVDWHIDHGAPDTLRVMFRLHNQAPSGWDKALVLRDNTGRSWTIVAKGGQQVQAGLEVGCLPNQPITFRKPGFLGVWTDAFSVNGLSALTGGDIVTFTWTKD
jgi:hypothetical protein